MKISYIYLLNFLVVVTEVIPPAQSYSIPICFFILCVPVFCYEKMDSLVIIILELNCLNFIVLAHGFVINSGAQVNILTQEKVDFCQHTWEEISDNQKSLALDWRE